jgi:branched-chain amino acid transport system permease protein
MSVAASQAPEAPEKTKKGFEIPPLAEKLIIPLVVAVIAILMPFFTDNQSFIQQCAVAVAYVVMALGLNIVVGFAGLLDLG